MKHLLLSFATLSTLALAACVDTTGISADLSRGPHPSTDPNAIVTVAEFADFQCPACKAAKTQISDPLIAKYGKRIRFDFMHFPLQSLHPHALLAAQAGECAADQGKFWEFVDINYENQDKLSKETIYQWSKDLGLDQDVFDRCVRSEIKKKAILKQYDQGRQLGVGGTPTFFVNGTKVDSDLAAISKTIDDLLKTATQRL